MSQEIKSKPTNPTNHHDDDPLPAHLQQLIVRTKHRKQLLFAGFLRKHGAQIPKHLTLWIPRWISFNDYIDRTDSDSMVKIQTLKHDDFIEYQKISRKYSFVRCKTVIGSHRVRRGMKRTWHFHVEEGRPTPDVVLGIVKQEYVSQYAPTLFNLGEFWNNKSDGGYIVSFRSGNKHHYGRGFPFFKPELCSKIQSFSMTLDLSQQQSDRGLLSYNAPGNEDCFLETNIAFLFEIGEQEYRCAIGLFPSSPEVAIYPTE